MRSVSFTFGTFLVHGDEQTSCVQVCFKNTTLSGGRGWGWGGRGTSAHSPFTELGTGRSGLFSSGTNAASSALHNPNAVTCCPCHPPAATVSCRRMQVPARRQASCAAQLLATRRWTRCSYSGSGSQWAGTVWCTPASAPCLWQPHCRSQGACFHLPG